MYNANYFVLGVKIRNGVILKNHIALGLSLEKAEIWNGVKY